MASKNVVAEVVQAAEARVAVLIANAANGPVRVKLRNLAGVCRDIVDEATEPLSVVEVVREYAKQYPEQPVPEQTIRNVRPGGNPYMEVVRAWQTVALAVSDARAKAKSGTGQIIRESDLPTIKDQNLRHQVAHLFAQNRSLHNRINMLKQIQSQQEIRIIDGPDRRLPLGGEGLVLTGAELDSIRDFLDPRKMKAKHLRRSEDDAVATIDGQAIADPGFMSALRKIVSSYEPPEA